jgi:pimeloyl-ACP methyl ester carboxylesterase
VEEERELQIRIDGDAALPTLIYLPGLHGDWTLLTGFREQAKTQFQLVQFTYPRSLRWTLEDYARAVDSAVKEKGILRGWVLAESYSSQVAWAWLKLTQDKATDFQFEGIVLAGGFVRYPTRSTLLFARALFALTPWWLWKAMFAVYLAYSGFRLRNAGPNGNNAKEFIARRTPLDIAAMRARVRLIAGADFQDIAARSDCPVYLLAGVIDPIVATRPVLRWFRKHCRSFKGHRIIWPADHTVLATEPAKSLEQIERWIVERVNEPSGQSTR